jgi:hypothetical protein
MVQTWLSSLPLPCLLLLLQTVHRLLQPAAGKVIAELYKLNIYGPDGFFRSHVDTPRGPNMFGSLRRNLAMIPEEPIRE